MSRGLKELRREPCGYLQEGHSRQREQHEQRHEIAKVPGVAGRKKCSRLGERRLVVLHSGHRLEFDKQM